MRFTYRRKKYDLRYQKRYLPKEIRDINVLDLQILLNAHWSSKEYRQSILNEYLEGAKIV